MILLQFPDKYRCVCLTDRPQDVVYRVRTVKNKGRMPVSIPKKA